MGKITKYSLVVIGLLLCQQIFGQVDARLLRYPDVSASHISFVYAGDIWLVAREGGLARRLSSPRGEEMFPRFSPDGTQLMFAGNYDGNQDVYVMPVEGGLPHRITHHPAGDRPVDWYPDGKSILYASRMESYRPQFNQFYKTAATGGMPEKLPVPYGEFAAMSPDGRKLAFTYIGREFSTWKRYRGGTAPDIWLFDLEKKTAENITADDANDTLPMWHGSTLYFLSDRGPKMRSNIWAHDLKTGEKRQVTFYEKFDVRFPAIGPRDIVFELGGRLFLLDLESEKTREVKVDVVTDLATLKPRQEKVDNLIQSAGISPSGKRVFFEARGEVFTVPAEHGVTLNLTRSPGVAERYPSWSPDGKWIAYWSDRSGEYELTLRPADGSGEEVRLTTLGPGFRYRPQWSPDSRKILFIDKAQQIRIYDRETKQFALVDVTRRRLHFALQGFTVSWSADSRWVAYSRSLENSNQAVFIYDIQAGKSIQVTTGFYSEWGPAFDPDGDYLYFFSSRQLRPVYSDLQPTWVYINSARIVAMALRKDVKSPLAARNDLEEARPGEDKKGKGDKGKKPGKPGDEKKEDGKGKAKPVKIDFDGLEKRLVILPPQAGNYGNLAGLPGKVLYHKFSHSGSADRNSPVMYYDLKARKEQTVIADVDRYILAAGGKKMLVVNRGAYGIIDVKPGQKMAKPLAVSLEMTVDPRAEWRQMFADTWRYGRDFFYDPGTHGVDWPLMKDRYGKLLEDAVTRWDVNFVIGELIGELGAGHIFNFGGQTEGAKRLGVGLLGVDFALENGAYRITKIYDVPPWDTELRSPLREPGVDVKEGDYLLAVNRVPLDTGKDPWAAFQGLAGKTVLLSINSTPSMTGAREVTVKTLTREGPLREKAWVEDNRKKVEAASTGKIGYVYVPDTSVNGQTEFVRQFRAQFKKQGLIIDERFNAGGQLADRFIEMMKRPLYHYVYFRDGDDWQMPAISNTGPKAMLINGWSGSGGDAFPFYFKQAELGPVIGTRTWGGLVGPAYPLPLIDGGMVSIPPGRFFDLEGKWIIENHGVDPDIRLVNDPGAMARGKDPQLDRAIDEVKKAMKKNPPVEPKKPPFPSELKKK